MSHVGDCRQFCAARQGSDSCQRNQLLITSRKSQVQSAAEGLDLQARTGIHAKIVLVTVGAERWSVVGSLNGGEVSHKLNRELLLLTDAPAIHARLAEMFGHDWRVGE